ncbi:hypothetical protein C8R46DRAFT_1309329 [Mycena filopes]|nr:hypothetical protein C8R46DRAFT_1309329 [Mycena filopes]
MSHLAPTVNIAVSETTHTLFTAAGTSIVWDASTATLVKLAQDQAGGVGVKDTVELTFDGEEIEDIATLNDEVFILTRRPTGDEWTRPWKRRTNGATDPDFYYENDRPVFVFTVRAFSADGRPQEWPALQIADTGVRGDLRVNPQRVMVKVIGHRCVAGIWSCPNNNTPKWGFLYSELTWDSNKIAREMGFRDAQEELEYLTTHREEQDGSEMEEDDDYLASQGDEPDEFEMDVDEAERKQPRDEYEDEETQDYAFLTDTLVVRLRDVATDEGELSVYLQVFRIPSVSSQEVAPTPPNLLAICVWYMDPHKRLSDSSLAVEPTSHGKRALTVCIHNDSHDVLVYSANMLQDLALNPPPAQGVDIGDALLYKGKDHDMPFVNGTERHVVPSISRGTLLFPACDLDPGTPFPKTPLIRFLRFAAPSYYAFHCAPN